MLDRKIFLIGLPGETVESLGHRAAQDLGISFLSMEQWMEDRSGMTAPGIAEKYGEDGFRKAETGLLALLTGEPAGLFVPWENTAMVPENRKIMRAWGSVILLDGLPEQDPLDARLAVYRTLADVVIPSGGSENTALLLLERVLKERYHA